MIRIVYTTILCILISLTAIAKSNSDTAYAESAIVLHTESGDILGTLTIPKNGTKVPIALIIAGSGPTDRNGDNPRMKNASLQKLAYELGNNNIASLRFDKRGIAASVGAGKGEADLRFEDYVNDVRGWIDLLRKDKRFSKLVVVGHSEGSLIGMIGAMGKADGFISVAGAGRSADKVIKEQLAGQPQQIQELCFPILDSLVAGKTVQEVNPMLFSLFRPSVQPYMISWFKYDPQTEIKKLNMPVLIIQGTNDLQVSVEDAQLLKKANERGELKLIQGMNHVFRVVGDAKNANIASYGNNALPISTELTYSIIGFIKSK